MPDRAESAGSADLQRILSIGKRVDERPHGSRVTDAPERERCAPTNSGGAARQSLDESFQGGGIT
jgi:hypothetical protein